MKINLAENIRAFRKDYSLTQEQLAEAMNVSVGAVSKWELGQSMPEISILIRLADFFDSSVDSLLGYEIQNNSVENILERLKLYQKNKNFRIGIVETEKALKKYPNNFDIVWRSGRSYFLTGLEEHNKAYLERAKELLTHSISLIHQNKNEKISELSIQIEIAEIYQGLNENEKAIELLKKNNPCQINHILIGGSIASCEDPERMDEALNYLSEGFLDLVSSIMRFSSGYTTAFSHKKNYQEALEMLLWTTNFFESIKITDEINYLGKIESHFMFGIAQMYGLLNDMENAEIYIRKAISTATSFDANPKYNLSNIRFYHGDGTGTAYDDLGPSALCGILELLKQDEDLPKEFIDLTNKIILEEGIDIKELKCNTENK